MGLGLGIGLAIVVCVMYGFSTLLQAVGTRKAAGLTAFLQPLVIIGLIADGAAFLISLVAYDYAPLFVVQTIIAAAVVISVLFAPKALPGVRLRAVDVVGAVVVVAGLVVCALAAGPDHDVRVSRHFEMTILIVAGVVLAACALMYRTAPAWLMATFSGIGYGLVAIGARAAEELGSWEHMLLSPAAVVVVAGGAVGVLGNLRALEKGSVAVAASIVSVIEVVIPSVVGIVVLGDQVRSGWGVPLVLGMVVALAGCVLLTASPASKAAEA